MESTWAGFGWILATGEVTWSGVETPETTILVAVAFGMETLLLTGMVSIGGGSGGLSSSLTTSTGFWLSTWGFFVGREADLSGEGSRGAAEGSLGLCSVWALSEGTIFGDFELLGDV